jgi:hypothetical protein
MELVNDDLVGSLSQPETCYSVLRLGNLMGRVSSEQWQFCLERLGTNPDINWGAFDAGILY